MEEVGVSSVTEAEVEEAGVGSLKWKRLGYRQFYRA